MDKVDLNNSPVLSMEDITKQLFNNDFMADVQFHVDGKVIYAHSWELMKRSIIFREQFRATLGVNKLIPIEDTTYEVVYEFLRFIYTDECTIGDGEMACDMLNLAVKYKIVKLENQVLNMKFDINANLKLFEFCLVNKYELYYNSAFDQVIQYLPDLVEEEPFLNIIPDAMEAILKSEEMCSEMSEFKLFNILVQWMQKSCESTQTQISERRSHFDRLLRHIRFPIMSSDEFQLCVKNHPDLFTSDDILMICQQIVLGEHGTSTKWRAEPRVEYVDSDSDVGTPFNHNFKTKFTVSSNLILHGLRYGAGYSDGILQISETNPSSNAAHVLRFIFNDSETYINTFSLGDSVKLKQNVDYTIDISYSKDYVFCREPDVIVIVTGPSELVTFTEISDNLFEIIFKLPIN